jgi:hypothetical protein
VTSQNNHEKTLARLEKLDVASGVFHRALKNVPIFESLLLAGVSEHFLLEMRANKRLLYFLLQTRLQPPTCGLYLLFRLRAQSAWHADETPATIR